MAVRHNPRGDHARGGTGRRTERTTAPDGPLFVRRPRGGGCGCASLNSGSFVPNTSNLMDVSRADLVLKFALTAAGQNDAGERELGPIHLLKYVYLADLAYAASHEGETFTGAPWRFYHYGPWSAEVNDRIRPAVSSIHANEVRYQSTFSDDFVRWMLVDDELYRELEQTLPFDITRSVRRAVRDFGRDTQGLLSFVYRTRPMVRAAPGEPLDFSVTPEVSGAHLDLPEQPVLSRKAQRRREEALANLRERVGARLSERLGTRHGAQRMAEPRYDDIFAEGQRVLDELAGPSLPDGALDVEFSDGIWKSRGRQDTELP